jgi:hypothetical protein
MTQFKKLDKMLRTKTNIKDVLDYTDQIILKDYYNLSDNDISQLKEIHSKLVIRRLKSNKLNF